MWFSSSTHGKQTCCLLRFWRTLLTSADTMANKSILIESVRNIYKYFAHDDEEIDSTSIFQDPRLCHQNHADCDLCFPLFLNGEANASISGLQLFPKYKQFKMTVNIKKAQEELPVVSQSWPLPIKICSSSPTSFCILLDHEKAFHNVISTVISSEDSYGRLSDTGNVVSLSKDSDVSEDEDCLDLTQLRTKLAFESLCKIFTHLGYKVLTECSLNNVENATEFHLCHIPMCPMRKSKSSLISCGAVLDIATGVKASGVSAKDYYRNKLNAFQEMAQDRDNPQNDEDQVTSLSVAEVTAELLSVKLHEHVSVCLSKDADSIGSTRGASFLHYNHVRLSSIRKKFEQEVMCGLYPKLPEIKDINFGLLTNNEEWELLLLVLKFPSWLVTCISPLGKISLHSVFIGLNKLCRIFSMYYRRVRVLTEPRAHLLPVMYARIYLLHCLEIVLGIGLSVFDMKPLDYM